MPRIILTTCLLACMLLSGNLQANTNSPPEYAIITGASRDTGRAIARELWDKGYNLILIARSYSKLSKVRDNLSPRPQQKVKLYAIDITNQQTVTQLFEKFTAKKLPIAVLVNNAAIFAKGSIELKPSELQHLLNVNVVGSYNMIKAAFPIMKQRESGHVINISSVAGNNAVSGVGSYSVSKYALRGLSDSLFKDLEAHGIKVSSISPTITTALAEHTIASNESALQTDDVAKAVGFLVSLSGNARIRDIEIQGAARIASCQPETIPAD